jgi:hypothetical protein
MDSGEGEGWVECLAQVMRRSVKTKGGKKKKNHLEDFIVTPELIIV